ncbi:hypothetical protein, partial [Ilyomonas limi]|uniref:hypothetical protein n=1 Tax=Ilyomonas limi TaxID=2575867 RepID=UPI00197D3D6E
AAALLPKTGGQFIAKSPGQFAPKCSGQLVAKWSGQYQRNLQFIPSTCLAQQFTGFHPAGSYGAFPQVAASSQHCPFRALLDDIKKPP